MNYKTCLLFLTAAIAHVHGEAIVRVTVDQFASNYNPVEKTAIDFWLSEVYGPKTTAQITFNPAITDSFTFDIAAPEGYRFALRSPEIGRLWFGIGWTNGGPGTEGNNVFASVNTISFGNLTGSFLHPDVAFFADRSGDTVGFFGSLQFGIEEVSFTSMTLTSDFSNITDRTGWKLGTFHQIGSVRSQAWNFSGNQPFGPSVTLVPVAVPEPAMSVYASVCLVLLGIAIFKRKGLTRR